MKGFYTLIVSEDPKVLVYFLTKKNEWNLEIIEYVLKEKVQNFSKDP